MELQQILEDNAKDCDKYGTNNVYQDIHENGIEYVYCRNVLPGDFTSKLPNWNQIIADKEAAEKNRNL